MDDVTLGGRVAAPSCSLRVNIEVGIGIGGKDLGLWMESGASYDHHPAPSRLQILYPDVELSYTHVCSEMF